MRLHPIQQKIITYLEPLPAAHQDVAKVSIIERGKLRRSETVTGMLRRLRQGESMIWDPWILKDGDIYRLFYLEGIGLATSTDGLHFSRYSHRPLLMPDNDELWYGRSNWTGHFYWREPYIFKDDKTGSYYMFICASSKVPGNFQGCIGLAVADKISGPYKLLSPAVVAPVDASEDWPYYHLERPQVIYKEGKYHLFFSCFKQFFNLSGFKQ